LQLSDRLSAITGAQVYLKREDLQTVRSYKLRLQPLGAALGIGATAVDIRALVAGKRRQQPLGQGPEKSSADRSIPPLKRGA
jgi:threonine dehydratase